jgi:hypothetical protein
MTKFLPYVAISVCLALTACSTTKQDSSTSTGSTEAMVGSLLPQASKIVNAQSLIMGSGDNWMGRMVLEVKQDSAGVYNFFLDNYPNQGWTLVSAVRGKTSLLVFTKPDRSATVEISDATLSGSSAVLTVSPKSTLPTAQPAQRAR